MPDSIPRALDDALLRRGLRLAERRRAYLAELYESGRWRRFYSKDAFLECAREAVRSVDAWTRIANSARQD
jgi:uncharacterized repeat protein (TIGR03809 family)